MIAEEVVDEALCSEQLAAELHRHPLFEPDKPKQLELIA